jgi:hypothetical protein
MDEHFVNDLIVIAFGCTVLSAAIYLVSVRYTRTYSVLAIFSLLMAFISLGFMMAAILGSEMSK